jgi:hypothetical protein
MPKGPFELIDLFISQIIAFEIYYLLAYFTLIYLFFIYVLGSIFSFIINFNYYYLLFYIINFIFFFICNFLEFIDAYIVTYVEYIFLFVFFLNYCSYRIVLYTFRKTKKEKIRIKRLKLKCKTSFFLENPILIPQRFGKNNTRFFKDIASIVVILVGLNHIKKTFLKN